MIKQSLVDLENMFSILEEHLDIIDVPGARDLEVHDAHVSFKNVKFSYDPKMPILRDVSFDIPVRNNLLKFNINIQNNSNTDQQVQSGHTVAVVGPTGAGKSTCTYMV